MTTTVKAFLVTLAIYAAIIIGCIILFSKWRRLKGTRKFFAPKRYLDTGHKPPRLPTTLLGWVRKVWSLDEDEIVKCGGVDTAIYMKYLRLCCELFFMISVVSLLVALPMNLTGGQVDDLIAANGYATETSNYTWWVPPRSEPSGNETESEEEESSDAAVGTIKPPKMYNDSIGDPPPGLVWWSYLPGVPPLASPQETLGDNYSTYGWRYDDKYTTIEYTFTDLDKTTMSNVYNSDPRLYGFAVLTWLVSVLCMWQFWRYCKVALRIRMFYLLRTPKGAQSHTVLCTDIPGIAQGTIPQRLDGTLLKFVPKSVKETAFAQVNRLQNAATTAAKGVTVPKSLLTTADDDLEAGGSTASSMDLDIGTTPDVVGLQPAMSAKESFVANLKDVGIESLSLKTFQTPDRWGEVCDQLDAGNGIQEVVEGAFKTVYDPHFSHAHIVYDTNKLDALVETYEATKDKLIDTIEKVFVMRESNKEFKRETKMILGAKMDAWGKEKYGLKPLKVDALTYYREFLDHLYAEIKKEQTACRAPGSTVYPASFVTFDSRKSQVVAAYSMMSEDLTTWKCQPAPAPEEIVWKNLSMRSWERSARRFVVWVTFIVMMMFFIIPVTAIQGLLTIDVSWIKDIPFLDAIFSSILPSLVLNWLLGFIPAILAWMNKWGGMVSETEVDHGVITFFFLFQIITVYLASFIAGSFASQLQQFIDDPSQIYKLLGSSAPQVGIFFTNFILFRAGFDMPIELLRPVSSTTYRIKSRFAVTQAAKDRLWSEQDVSYGELIPTDMLSALVGLAFCLVAPLIAPITLLYYLVCYLINKYNLLYCYEVPYESGGQAWKKIFNQLTGCLLLYQLTMLAILAIKDSPISSLVILPLPFITLAYLSVAHKTFWQPMMTLSMLSAAVLDEIENEEDGGADNTAEEINAEVKQKYLSPSFKVDGEEHQQLIKQALAVEAALNSGNLDALKEVDAEGNELVIPAERSTTATTAGNEFVLPLETGVAGGGVDDDPFYTPTDTPRGSDEGQPTPFGRADDDAMTLV